MKIRFSVDAILELLGSGVTARGDYRDYVTGIAGLGEARRGDLSFLANTKYRKQLGKTEASVVLVPPGTEFDPAENQLFLETEDPSLALARICRSIEAKLWPKPEPGVHPTSVIDPSAEVDPAASVGPLCWIGPGAVVGAGTQLISHVAVGRDARVGRDCWFAPHVSIGDYCEVGERCRFHAGVVIGSDGFGYAPHGDRLEKLPQIGTVVIEDDVEIGANTTVDRARFAETRVGAGSKLDNLVQIGHNCRIGRSSALASQVGVSGSAEIGSGVLILGQAGVGGHVQVGDRAEVGPRSGISKSVGPGEKVLGFPLMQKNEFARVHAVQRRLPEILKRIEKLEEIVDTRP